MKKSQPKSKPIADKKKKHPMAPVGPIGYSLPLCMTCAGRGVVNSAPCAQCRGSGVAPASAGNAGPGSGAAGGAGGAGGPG